MILQVDLNTTDTSTLKWNIVPAWLNLADVCFVLMLIPIMDKIVYPWLDKKGRRLSVFKRISIGEYKLFQL